MRNCDSLANWASVELKRGRRDVAASLLDRAIALNPNVPQAAELTRELRGSR